VKLAVWKTGHEIADRVAQAFDQYGLVIRTPPSTELQVSHFDTHIAYGILRGTADVFRECDRLGKPWLHIDRGYFGASHFDGTYRISYRGTQQTGNWPAPSAHNVELKPWRGFDHSKPVLVVPPTKAVQNFFGTRRIMLCPPNHVIRHKGDPSILDFNDYNYVVTFNSSLGWQAIAAGIPCVSDPTHSMVGAMYRNIGLDKLSETQHLDRERLFGTMSSLQMTLKEIEDGKAWPLIKHLLSENTLLKHETPSQKPSQG
jgi:hypothetical protein